MLMTIDFSKGGGLVPVIVQDWKTGEVLMLAYMNEEAWKLTRETGKVHYYSRSRGRLWLKGESSGHFQEVQEILVDCDEDTLVVRIRQEGGAACHLGYRSCFFRRLENESWTVAQERVFDPEEVYRK
jgi:phosphoribosyl-AMP cyclohydrolase